MTPSTNRPSADRRAIAARATASAAAAPRGPLEPLESRTLFAAVGGFDVTTSATSAAGGTFLIGGEVVSVPSAVVLAGRSAVAASSARFVVVVGAGSQSAGLEAVAGRVGVTIGFPPGGSADGGFARFGGMPTTRVGQPPAGPGRVDADGDDEPARPTPRSPGATREQQAVAATNNAAARADAGLAGGAGAAIAAAASLSPADATSADVSADVEPIAGGPVDTALLPSADADDAAAMARSGDLDDGPVAGLGRPLSGDATIDGSPSSAAAALAAAFSAGDGAAAAGPATSAATALRDALSRMAADVLSPGLAAGAYSAGAALALLPSAGTSLAAHLLGFGGDGPGDVSEAGVPEGVVAAVGVGLAAAGYWRSAAPDRDARRSAADDGDEDEKGWAGPARGWARDRWSLSPFGDR